MVLRHLHWLGTVGPVTTRLSLICIGAFTGVEPFHGLGQLTPAQLASLFPSRRPITRAEVNAGSDVWRAFTSDDPRALNLIVHRGMAELPFMQGAIRRYLEEFPGLQDGLSRTERAVLREIRYAARSARELFHALQGQEERVLMGDLSFWRLLRDLAAGPVPLIEMEKRDSPPSAPETVPMSAQVRIAAAGARVLAGEDAVRLRGMDRWLGGVHLTPERLWRWDGNEIGLR